MKYIILPLASSRGRCDRQDPELGELLVSSSIIQCVLFLCSHVTALGSLCYHVAWSWVTVPSGQRCWSQSVTACFNPRRAKRRVWKSIGSHSSSVCLSGGARWCVSRYSQPGGPKVQGPCSKLAIKDFSAIQTLARSPPFLPVPHSVKVST